MNRRECEMDNLRTRSRIAAQLKRSGRNTLLIALAVCLAACATAPTADQLTNADYGPPPPENHQQIIKDWFEERLIDPTSPLYSFRNPAQGYTQENAFYGTQLQFGWIICGTVNAKNRYGAYVGREPFFTLFSEGKMVFAYEGLSAGEACKRVGG